jgi:hypothetical protein
MLLVVWGKHLRRVCLSANGLGLVRSSNHAPGGARLAVVKAPLPLPFASRARFRSEIHFEEITP